MASTADLLLIFEAQDNVSNVANQIQGNVEQMGAGMGNAGRGIRGTMQELGGIFRGINGLVMGVFGAYGLSTFKNMTYGTATAREQILQLYESVAGSTKQAGPALDLWNKMDELTNHGYVSLDQLGQAVNVLGMSAGATVPQMDSMVTLINEVGNRAILMGYDANRTQLLMNNVATGLNGNMQMLNNAFGVTKDKLKNLGWSGAATDVEGYNKALRSYLGISDDAGEHLDNTQGKVIALQKRFRIAGRNLGNFMLPYINAIMDAFTKLNEQSGDMLAKMIIIGTGAMSGFASILPTISPVLQTYDFIEKKFKGIGGACKSANGCMLKQQGAIGGIRKATTTLFSPIRRVTSFIYEWMAYPVFNYLRTQLSWVSSELWRIAKIPAGSVFDAMTSSYNNFKQSQTIQNIREKYNTGKSLVGKGVEKVYTPYSGFIQNYGKEVTAIKLRNKEFTKWKQLVSDGIIDFDPDIASYIAEQDAIDGLTLKKKILEKATRDGAEAHAIEAALTKWGTGIVDFDTIANVANAGSEDVKTASKERGIIATKLSNLWTKIHTATIGRLTVANEGLAVAEGLSMWWLLAIIAAILALIAVVNEIGKTFGWWDNWSEAIMAVWAGLQRLWSAFINSPQIQGTIKMFQDAFGGLGNVIGEVAWAVLEFFGWKDDGSEFDIVHMIIEMFGTLGRVMGDVVNIAKTVFSALWTIIGPIAGAIWWALRSIVCILMGCSPGIVPALQSVYEAFTRIFSGLAVFIKGPVDIIRTTIGTIIQIIQLVISTVGQAFNIIGGIITGKISLTDGLKQLIGLAGTYLTQLGGIFRNHFTRIISIVINSAKRLVGGFINNILGFPRRVLQILMGLINNIINLPQQMANGAMQMAGGLEEGFLNGVRDWIPGASLLLGPKTNNYGQGTARTLGNVNKNYTNTSKRQQGHTFNIGAGAIQLDARNLTTKESKQVMINALEGLTTQQTAQTKKQAKGG